VKQILYMSLGIVLKEDHLLTVGELISILNKVDKNFEIKPYIKNLDWKISFWYFELGDIDIREDGVYIELL